MIATMNNQYCFKAVAVVFGSLFLPACDPTCTMYVHSDKIMAGQSNVIDCGRHLVTDSAEVTDRFVACMNDAIRTDRPFRAEPNVNHPGSRGTREMQLGRIGAMGYEVLSIGWSRAGQPNQAVSAMRCSAPTGFTKQALGSIGWDVYLSCPEIEQRRGPLPPQPPYLPPQSVPSGYLCGVQ